jgi:signal transduction histidine kinase
MFIAFCCIVLIWVPARALDPSRHVSQYGHTVWRLQDGIFDGAPYTITQTKDGYVWIGTVNGLVFFDGVRFVPWKSPKGAYSQILSLFAGRDGALWIGTPRGLSRLRNQELFEFPGTSGISSIDEDPSGTIWVTRYGQRDGGGPVCRVNGEKLECFGKKDGIPVLFAIGITIDSQGNFWIGSNILCRWKPGETARTYFDKEQGHREFAVHAMTAGRDGSVLAALEGTGQQSGIRQYADGAWINYSAKGFDPRSVEVGALLMDRDHALWVGTLKQGLYRIYNGTAEHFGSENGLSGDAVRDLHQDDEGNLWVLTNDGVDMFRDLSVISFSLGEGLKSTYFNSVLASGAGSILIGSKGALDVYSDGKFSSITSDHGLPGHSVGALFEDGAGQIWLTIDYKLMIYSHGKFLPAVRKKEALSTEPEAHVVAMTQDATQNIWVLDHDIRGGRHLFRLDAGTVREVVTLSELHYPGWLAADRTDGVWIASRDQLARYRNGHLETWSLSTDHKEVVTTDLLVDSENSVWVATRNGLYRWKDGELKSLTTGNGLPCDSIFSLVEDDQGALWLSMQCGLVRIERAELSKWWKQPAGPIAIRVFDAFDGVRSGNIEGPPKASKAKDGRLWFVNPMSLQMVDPRHLYENPVSPRVSIQNIVADHKGYSPDSKVQLPALTRDLEIDYTALSYTVPQKVRFRYKLEGRDADWQSVSNHRQAFYTDLAPGSYRFRVSACNNSGVWSQADAWIDFSVAPAYYQTTWFRLSSVAVFVLLAGAFYQFRLKQVARQVQGRMQERMEERERIARNLHDTLQQTLQGSKLVADDALENPSDPVHMRRAMEQLSAWLGRAIHEGRAALNSLRTSITQTNDLAEAFKRAAEETRMQSRMEVSFSVTGQSQEMHPVVRDEIYRIGYEAIRNAYTHSNGGQLAVSLRYGKDLAVSVRDNGVGIDPTVADHGKNGHFGLQGMRERAGRIGGKLTVVSSPDSGTEVMIVVPGGIVFRESRATILDKMKNAFRWSIPR